MGKLKMPLRCVVRGDQLIISVNDETIKFATENHPTFFDGDKYTIRVKNKRKWLKSVVYRLNCEEEDGSTILTEMLDKAIEEAVEQGEEGLYDE